MPEHDPQVALYTAAQVRALDRAATADFGIPGIELMRRAAQAALAVLRRRWPEARELCVLGNNGGDGFLLAALAREAGLDARVIAVAEQSRGDAGSARARYLREDGSELPAGSALPDADVYVDALFGSGLNRAPDGEAARLIRAVNAQARPVLALDVPSGLDSDTGVAFDPCVRASATVCFVGWKRGLFTAQGPDACGDRVLAALELPAEVHAMQAHDAVMLTARSLPPRPRDSHKGRYGHVLAIGGDIGAGGAVRMCAQAALRV